MSGNINCLKVNAENKERKQYVHEVRQTPPTSPPPSSSLRGFHFTQSKFLQGTENDLTTCSIWTKAIERPLSVWMRNKMVT